MLTPPALPCLQTDPLNIPGDGDPNDIYNLSDLDLTMKNVSAL